jgi:hypothetical protein
VNEIILAKDAAWRPPGLSYAATDKSVPSTESVPSAPVARQPDGTGAVAVSGELNPWHKGRLMAGSTCDLDLTAAQGEFRVSWFTPRTGGALVPAGKITAGAKVPLGHPPADAGEDWTILVRR